VLYLPEGRSTVDERNELCPIPHFPGLRPSQTNVCPSGKGKWGQNWRFGFMKLYVGLALVVVIGQAVYREAILRRKREYLKAAMLAARIWFAESVGLIIPDPGYAVDCTSYSQLRTQKIVIAAIIVTKYLWTEDKFTSSRELLLGNEK